MFYIQEGLESVDESFCNIMYNILDLVYFTYMIKQTIAQLISSFRRFFLNILFRKVRKEQDRPCTNRMKSTMVL